MRQLRGALVVGWLLVACGPSKVTADEAGGGGEPANAGATSGGGGNASSAGAANGGAPGAAGKANDAGASNSSEAGQGGFDFPVPPPAQGATTFSVSAISPSPPGKACPVASL